MKRLRRGTAASVVAAVLALGAPVGAASAEDAIATVGRVYSFFDD